MKYVLRIIDVPGIVVAPTTITVGHYIERFDPDYCFPVGRVITTEDKGKAKRFDDMASALAYWKQELGDAPRWDGQPNRPLTALSVEVERITTEEPA